jgi:CopG family nickel-responsive transcriptional regulator
MAELERLSFSIEPSLAAKLEKLVKISGYGNRSEYIRDMIRDRLVREEWEHRRGNVIGTITMVYDHHARHLSEKLTDIQHDHHGLVLATTHVHLDHDLCAEMIMMRGPAARLRELADRIRQQKGVLHAELAIGSTGKDLR